MEITIDGTLVTVEEVARAWASLDGNRDEFDREKTGAKIVTGHYEGYIADAEALLQTALRYANLKSRQLVTDRPAD
jgi:hypothetical protein